MKTILVIEDEQAIRESLCDLLEVEGFSVLDADRGEKGVQIAEAQLPDLILCDIHMPDMDGYHVLSQLRQSPHASTIPFIFLTARGGRADQRQGMNLGADDYLVKPCSAQEILAAIASRIDRQNTLLSQSQQQLETLRHNIALFLPHELHTPLNGILLFAELLMTEVESINRSELLEIAEGIHSSANRLYRLTQNFLYYVQLEIAAHDPVKRQAFCGGRMACPDWLITKVATHLAKQANRLEDLSLQLFSESQKESQMKFLERNREHLEEMQNPVLDKFPVRAEILKTRDHQSQGELESALRLTGAAVSIADTRLQKVLEELLDNAFKFSAPGSPVQVTSAIAPEGFVIQIVDQGRGMTPEQIATLGAYMQFDRHFYEQQGTGLGLVIAKRLLELHEGRLEIESAQQTRIKIVIPLIADEL